MLEKTSVKTLENVVVRFSGDSGARAFEVEQDERINEELRSVFRPEFLNRIDEKIIFRRLSREEIRRLTRRMLGCVASRLTELGMELELPEEVVDVIANSGYDEKYGARPLRRVIRSLIEDKAAEMLLDGELERGDKVLAAVSSGSVTLTKME